MISLLKRPSRSWASTTWFPRALATRSIKEGTPSCIATTQTSLHRTRAVGRANLANIRPVIIATETIPQNDSTVTNRFAGSEIGDILP